MMYLCVSFVWPVFQRCTVPAVTASIARQRIQTIRQQCTKLQESSVHIQQNFQMRENNIFHQLAMSNTTTSSPANDTTPISTSACDISDGTVLVIAFGVTFCALVLAWVVWGIRWSRKGCCRIEAATDTDPQAQSILNPSRISLNALIRASRTVDYATQNMNHIPTSRIHTTTNNAAHSMNIATHNADSSSTRAAMKPETHMKDATTHTMNPADTRTTNAATRMKDSTTHTMNPNSRTSTTNTASRGSHLSTLAVNQLAQNTNRGDHTSDRHHQGDITGLGRGRTIPATRRATEVGALNTSTSRALTSETSRAGRTDGDGTSTRAAVGGQTASSQNRIPGSPRRRGGHGSSDRSLWRRLETSHESASRFLRTSEHDVPNASLSARLTTAATPRTDENVENSETGGSDDVWTARTSAEYFSCRTSGIGAQPKARYSDLDTSPRSPPPYTAAIEMEPPPSYEDAMKFSEEEM
ncbi:hypothetical protein BaRGS_00021419 [Batillaria attramentaria]|uniref:Uncharacterized protein n=1 Tax=Batillaria attramentaria TaxID=370345 RepID=A0ABD0KKL4_9CAEN